jgi:hypothetical protein
VYVESPPEQAKSARNATARQLTRNFTCWRFGKLRSGKMGDYYGNTSPLNLYRGLYFRNCLVY